MSTFSIIIDIRVILIFFGHNEMTLVGMTDEFIDGRELYEF